MISVLFCAGALIDVLGISSAAGTGSFQDGALFKNMEYGAISVLLGATFDNLSDVEFKSNEASAR